MLRQWMPRDKYFTYQNFPRHFHFSLFLEWCGEIWKNRKLCWEPRQRIDRQLSKLRFKATVNVNVSRLVTFMSSRKPRFEIYVWQILFWRDSFVQDLDASVELRHYQSLSLKIFFLFLTEWYSLFPLRACFSVSFFLTRDFLLLLIFPWAKIFP